MKLSQNFALPLEDFATDFKLWCIVYFYCLETSLLISADVEIHFFKQLLH